MKKLITIIIVSVCLIVACSFYYHFYNNQEKEFISEWDKLHNSLSSITWEYDENFEEETNLTQIEFTIPKTSGFKSYMGYNLFSKSSKQYKLQQYANTDENGLRVVNDRYMIAVGTHYFSDSETIIGTYLDLILENGTVIECVVGDIKADIHTDEDNIVTLHNGCVSEFICDTSTLHNKAKSMGDVSYIFEEWNSPVNKIIVYERNVFDE